MATALYAFRDVRVAPETSGNGTKETVATQRLLGILTAPMSGVVLHRPKEERGSLAAERRTIIVGEELPLIFEGDLLFDQVMYPFNMGVEDIQTPAGEPAPYIWQFDPDLDDSRVPLACTFQYGDNLKVFDIEYCIVRQIQISGVMNEVAKIRYEMFGRHFEIGAFSPLQGDTTIDPASTEVGLANKTILYIDAAGGSHTTTPMTASLLSYTWTLDTGYRPVIHGGSEIYYDSIIQNFPKVTIEITAEFNTLMEAQRVIRQAGTGQLFALKISGTGSDFLTLITGGVFTSWEPLGQEEGLSVVRFTVESQLVAGIGCLFQASLSNSIPSLP